jgi:hypothetical protein
MCRASAAVSAAFVLAAAAPATTVRLEPIEVRFLYVDSAKWSGNKLNQAGLFTGWNSVIGEGDAGGAMSDALVLVPIKASGNDEEAIFAGAPVTLTATAGKKLLGKRVSRDLLIPMNGRAYTALYLADIPCAGRIDIKAQYKGQVRSARLNMDCGE